ncbi:MAG TPA: zinc ABC transporter permease [Cryomorphaceae bacterium]|nr:zinc ABC transporter permease [Cryomorphaceae bacterium]
MNDLIKYLTLSDPNVRYVALAILLLGGVSGAVGTFNFLRKKTLIGETVAHSMLPGVLIAFMLSGVKNPLYLIIGAAVSGWISIWVVDYITRHSKIKGDSALAIVLSSFFGLGIVMLTIIQRVYIKEQSGLDNYIFGNAAAMTPEDSVVFGVVSLIVLFVVARYYFSLKTVVFNQDFAQSVGINTKWIETVIRFITIISISVGIKAVGIVMMSALLIIPPTAARFWTDSLGRMLFVSGVFGAVSGWLGAYISYSYSSMPTGPWTIVMISVIAFVSLMFAPKKGVIFQRWSKLLVKRRMNEENLLKTAVQLEVRGKGKLFNRRSISTRQVFDQRLWNRTIKRLRRKGMIKKVHTGYTLSTEGRAIGAEIDRRHKIWEVYLQRRMQMSLHLVHDEADTMEHFLTPEIEVEILKELGLCSRFNPLLEIHEIVPEGA